MIHSFRTYLVQDGQDLGKPALNHVNPPQFSSLPAELLKAICAQLALKDGLRCSVICRDWKKFMEEHKLIELNYPRFEEWKALDYACRHSLSREEYGVFSIMQDSYPKVLSAICGCMSIIYASVPIQCYILSVSPIQFESILLCASWPRIFVGCFYNGGIILTCAMVKKIADRYLELDHLVCKDAEKRRAEKKNMKEG